MRPLAAAALIYSRPEAMLEHTWWSKEQTVPPHLHEVRSGRHVSGHVSRKHGVERRPRGIICSCGVRGINVHIEQHTWIPPPTYFLFYSTFRDVTAILSLPRLCQLLSEYDSEMFDQRSNSGTDGDVNPARNCPKFQTHQLFPSNCWVGNFQD